MLASQENLYAHSRVYGVKFTSVTAHTDDTSKGITLTPQETGSGEADSKSSKLLERNRERRKIVSAALEDLTECEEEEEENLSINLSTSQVSSLSSFKNKFRSLSFTGKNKV